MTKEEIRSVLAPMLRGDSVRILDRTVKFTEQGEFVFPQIHTRAFHVTPSLAEAVELLHASFNCVKWGEEKFTRNHTTRYGITS